MWILLLQIRALILKWQHSQRELIRENNCAFNLYQTLIWVKLFLVEQSSHIYFDITTKGVRHFTLLAMLIFTTSEEEIHIQDREQRPWNRRRSLGRSDIWILACTRVLRPADTSSAPQRGVGCWRTQWSTEAQQARTCDAAFYFLDVGAHVLT